MASDGRLKETEPQNIWGQTSISPAPHTGDVRQSLMPELSEEERLVMKECDKESFYQRALPLSLGCMLGAHMLVKSGRWNPHPKFGSWPKAIIASSFGYFIGRLSYIPACQQKIIDKIPNSNLAVAVRKSKGIPEPNVFATSSNDDVAAPRAPSSRVRDDYSAPQGLDERFRPTLDRDVKLPETPLQENDSISYEELRRRNRQDYESQTSKSSPKAPGAPSYKDSPFMPQKPWPDAKSGDTNSSSGLPQAPKKKRTNIWGDPIDE